MFLLFDLHTISGRASFAASHRLSEGVQEVRVNGGRVLRKGENTGATPGRVVRKD